MLNFIINFSLFVFIIYAVSGSASAILFGKSRAEKRRAAQYAARAQARPARRPVRVIANGKTEYMHSVHNAKKQRGKNPALSAFYGKIKDICRSQSHRRRWRYGAECSPRRNTFCPCFGLEICSAVPRGCLNDRPILTFFCARAHRGAWL